MQYIGQTSHTPKNVLASTMCMKKPKQFDTFLYQHFKRTGHSPNDISVQPVEKITYQENSSIRLKLIKRHETELR